MEQLYLFQQTSGETVIFNPPLYMYGTFRCLVFFIISITWHLIPLKEPCDEEIIDSALLKISESEANELKTHFVYTGSYNYNSRFEGDRILQSFILEGMKKYKIKSVMVTMMEMMRRFLITKEEMENYCKGKKHEKDSVNDDLESFFEDLQLEKEPDEAVITYFLPKLTQNELKLVERKDPSYLEKFIYGAEADVEEAEMKLSESKSKFVRGYCYRRTFTIERDSIWEILLWDPHI